MHSLQIIPTILTNSQKDLTKKLDFLEEKVEWVQIDVIDGRFAPNKTFDLELLDNFQEKGFFWDIHLMVKNPFSWVAKCNFVMAQRVVGQIEFMDDQLDFIDRVEGEGMEAGLAVDLDTPLKRLNHEAAFRSSVILLLSVKAGWSGQKFNSKVLSKLKELIKLRKDLGASFRIGMDGGLNKNNLGLLKKEGVEIAYIGSAIWNSSNWEKTLRELNSLP